MNFGTAMLNKYFRLKRWGILFALWVGALALVGCEIEEAARATAVPTTATTPLAVASETATATPAPLGTATPSLTPSPVTVSPIESVATITLPPAELAVTRGRLSFVGSDYSGSPEAISQIRFAHSRMDGTNLITVAAPSVDLGDFGEFIRSDDGRYMVYGSDTPGGSLDLYWYDALTGETRLLTNDPLQENPIAFSPNGDYLIYLMAEAFSYEGADLNEIRAYSFKDGSSISLYTPEDYAFFVTVFGWTDEQTALLATGFYEFPNQGLRRVNVATGAVELLLEDAVPNSAAVNPKSGWMIANNYFGLNPQEAEVNPPSDFDTINLYTGERGTLSVPSEWGRVYWFESLNLFATYTATETHFFDDLGRVVFSLPWKNRGKDLSASPDGQWLAARDNNRAWSIFDNRGTIRATLQGQSIHWLPNGRGLFTETTDEAGTRTLFYADTANDWQPQPFSVAGREGLSFAGIIENDSDTRATATPIPIPLASSPPWLFIEDSTFSAEPTMPLPLSQEFWLSNVDGTGLTHLDQIPPAEDGGDFIAYLEPPQGHYLAGIVIQPPFDHILYVWELPSQRLIRKVSLIEGAIRAEIQDRGDLNAMPFSPALRGVVWSPDARSVAYAALVDDGTTDLFLLETATGETRRIAQGNHNLSPVEWSPDGRWLLYYNTEVISVEGPYPDEVWVYDTVNDRSRYLFDSDALEERVVGWVDGDTAVTVSNAFEGNNSAPRRVNMATGEVLLLDEGNFGTGDLDPIHGVFLLNRMPIGLMIPDEGIDPHEFTAIDVHSAETYTFTVPSDGYSVRWLDDLQQFATYENEQYFLFNAQGIVSLTFPAGSSVPAIKLSPNREWIAVFTPDGWDIYTKNGELLADLNIEMSQIEWLPDNRLLEIHWGDEKRTLNLYNVTRDWQLQPITSELPDIHRIYLVQ